MKVTFIEHSGFMVELDKSVLLFDYMQGKIPEVSPNKDMYVFASHAHHDHYVEEIWTLREKYPKITYILSDDIATEEKAISLASHMKQTIGALEVETLKSNDEGLAFVVTVEGKTIYHAGDLNWWHWNGEPEEDNIYYEKTYREEIARIEGRYFDVAFVPLDPRQEDKYCWGMNYFLEHTDTRNAFPMHAFGKYKISKHYLGCDDGRTYEGIVKEITGPSQAFEI